MLSFYFRDQYLNPKKDELMKPNEFGDSFGVLNALFSGLAFAGLLYSIRLQAKALSDSQQALADSQNEMASQGAEFLEQTKSMNRQAFDNAFFQLLNFNNEIAKNTSFNMEFKISAQQGNNVINKGYSGSGTAAFKEIYRFLCDKIYEDEYYYIPHTFTKVQEAYMSFHDVVGEHLAHYFRNLYQVLKFIDESEIFDGHQKKRYSNMLRAQVSKYELALLFYNCLSPLGIEKFKPLLEKYEFFEHLPSALNIPLELIGYYDVSVFGWTNKDLYFNHMRSKIDSCRKCDNVLLKVFLDGKPMPLIYKRDYLPSDSKIIKYIKSHQVIWLETEFE